MIKKLSLIFNYDEKKKFLTLLILYSFGILLEMLSLGAILPLVSAVLDPATTVEFLKKYNLTKIAEYNIDINNIVLTVLILVIFIFSLKNLILFLLQKKQAQLLARYNENLVNEIYYKYLNQPIKNLMQYNTAHLSRNIIEVTNLFSNNFLSSLLNLIIEVFLLVAISIVLVVINPYFTLLAYMIIVSIGVLIYKHNKTKLLEVGVESKFYWGERLKQIQETFSGILEVKTFGTEKSFYEKFKDYNKKLANISITLSIINIIPKLLFETIIVIIICFSLVFLINIDVNIKTIIPLIGLFSYAFLRIMPSINKILISVQRLKYSVPIVDEIIFIKKLFIETDTTKVVPVSFDNDIKIKNLEFSFLNENKLFSNLNFEIKKNSMIGIYGESGSGKTTLLKILLGLYKPSTGDIHCDSKSIFSNLKGWQSIIGFVPQNVYILDKSLKFNLTLNDSVSESQLIKLNDAIKQTNLVSFLNNLPNGYETELGEVGQRISGGQKQRIGIARALYTNPKILILDESTSNLDDDTENQILNELKTLKDRITIIIVSHKKSIKNFCDIVYEIKNKEIIKTN